MRKIFLAVAAMAMLATACTKDDSALVGNESLVSFSVSSPELATRYGEGTTANQLYYAFYEADENGVITNINPLSAISALTEDKAVELKSGKATINVHLVDGRHYAAIFWAQAPQAPYTINWESQTMSYDATATLTVNNEDYDAFYAYYPVSTEKTHKVTLTRPFAQINIATAEKDYDNAKNAGFTAAQTKVVVKGVCKSFDLVNGKVAADEQSELTFDWDDIAECANANCDGKKAGYMNLAMNYVLVEGRRLVTVEMYVNDTDVKRTYTTVPVERNYRTYILGNLLTTQNDFTVETKPGFDGEYPKTDLEKLIMDIQTVGGEFTLTENITLEGTLELRHDVVLDLGGHTINVAYAEGSTTNHIYAFENHANFTLKNGTVNARGIFNYGNMTVEDGVTINAIDCNGGYGVRNYPGATFTMNGGTIATTNEDGDEPKSGNYDASPVRVDEDATFTMNGGVINNVSNFTVAIDNYGTTTINGGEATTVHTTLANSATMTINGGSFTCNGLEGITAHALWAAAGTTTINGGTFNGKDNYNGFNVDADNGAVVYIHGGNFLPVHSGSLYGKGTIIVDGGTFFDKVADARLAEGYAVVEENGAWTVVAAASDATTLATAIAKGGKVVLTGDITTAEVIEIPAGVTTTIDLNGKTITVAETDAIVAKAGANLTIAGNGKVTSHAAPIRAIGGKITVEGGEFTQTGHYYSDPSTLRYSVDSREGGEIIIKGGNFATVNGMINVSANSSVVIEGGNFMYENPVATTRHFAYVAGDLTIKDGVFVGKANGSAGGTFFCGAGANGKVTVEGGKFTSLWISGAKNNIWESYFGGSIEIKGGIFNHNGGITTQVIANTDAATKDAYPYMAK